MTTKKPATVLKRLPPTPEATGTLDDFLAYARASDPLAEPPPEEGGFTAESVSTVLATAMLHATLPPRVISRIQSSGSLALVVAVPGADYVGPICSALGSFKVWSEIIKRTGASRSGDKPNVGNDGAAGALGAGLSVLGVSTAPDRYLPSALMAGADLRIELRGPTPAALRATIRLITGRRAGPLSPDAIQGLSFDETVACIRRGSTARDCIRRLKAASASKRQGASDLADVPLLEDVHGYGRAKDDCLAMVAAVRAYRDGAAWPQAGTRFVLAGPPGCGKTTLVRSIAKSLGVKLTVTSVSSWFAQTAGYLNDICRKIDDVFLEASQSGGILLLDELDGLPNRETCDSRYRDYWSTVVNHVLMTLDGAVSSPASRLIVIGATNFADRLDAALTRPGRLDRIVHVTPPDPVAIEGILRQHLGEDLRGEDLRPVAAIGAGATGADIAGWVAGARMAARSAGRTMAMADLLDQITPPETRSPAELLAVARHEASHATVLEREGIAQVAFVSIVARGPFAGRTSSRLSETAMAMATAAEVDALVVSTLAGRAADERWGAVNSGSAGSRSSDLARATALVAGKHAALGLGDTLVYRGENVSALIESDPAFRRTVHDDLARLYGITREMVARDADLIDRIARRLVEVRVMSGDEVRSIIAGTPAAGAAQARQADVGGIHA